MKCKYCGLKAGFFSNVHKECEEKHKQGIAELFACIRSFLSETIIYRLLPTKYNQVNEIIFSRKKIL